jgi:hypothetical protein
MLLGVNKTEEEAKSVGDQTELEHKLSGRLDGLSAEIERWMSPVE